MPSESRAGSLPSRLPRRDWEVRFAGPECVAVTAGANRPEASSLANAKASSFCLAASSPARPSIRRSSSTRTDNDCPSIYCIA